MAAKSDLQTWILEALRDLGPSHVADVAKHIWRNREAELRLSGDLFYTWQYDMRWQAQLLQHQGKLEKRKSDRRWTAK